MQINLIPKTREQEQRRNQINSIIIMISVSILIAVGVIAAVFFGINASKKSNIKKEDSKISDLRADIEKYKDVENNINSLVTGFTGIQSIVDGQKDLTSVYRHLQALLPRESWLNGLDVDSSKVSFKVNAITSVKISEAIKALEDYEVDINKISDKSTDNVDDKETKEVNMVKMFKNVDVTKFIRNVDSENVYFECAITADISEEIWQTN